MILKNQMSLSGCLLMATVLVSCGNKGDLFLIPDPVSEQDIQQLQLILDIDKIPTAEPIEVNDQNVYPKTDTDRLNTPGRTSVDQ